jgi:hypothetical protein
MRRRWRSRCPHEGVERALEQLAEHTGRLVFFAACVRRAIAAFTQFVPHCLLSRCARSAARRSGVSFMIGGMILLVVATGVFASTVAGMLNDGRRLP